jgi:hypothetical protein
MQWGRITTGAKKTHGKESMVDFCTVKSHYRSPSIKRTVKYLCRASREGAQQKKRSARRRTQKAWDSLCRAPAQKRTAKIGPLPCAYLKTHGKDRLLSCAHVKTHDKELGFVVCPIKNTRQRSYSSLRFWSLCRAPTFFDARKVTYAVFVHV